MSSLVSKDYSVSESLGTSAEIYPGISEIKVLSQDQCVDLIKKIDCLPWRTSTVAEVRGFSRIEYAREDIRSALAIGEFSASEIVRSLMTAVEEPIRTTFVEAWGISSIVARNPQFTKYNFGHFIKSHTDNGEAYPKRVASVVLYLSDDYEGGEISFPRLGVTLKPTQGTALIFPSEYVHEVKPILGGTKYIFLFFLEVL